MKTMRILPHAVAEVDGVEREEDETHAQRPATRGHRKRVEETDMVRRREAGIREKHMISLGRRGGGAGIFYLAFSAEQLAAVAAR
jgi:hypothetical protein